MKIATRFAAALAVLGISCSSREIGDARFIDHGFTTAAHRYEIDFGLVDLSKPGIHQYVIRRLPAERLTVGLEAVPPQKDWLSGPAGEIVVSLKVVRGSGSTGGSAPLREWTWSETRGVPQVFGYLDTAPSNSTFTADPAGEYHVRVDVASAPGNLPSYQVHLKAYGGGWK
jgi:hypothetical protein